MGIRLFFVRSGEKPDNGSTLKVRSTACGFHYSGKPAADHRRTMPGYLLPYLCRQRVMAFSRITGSYNSDHQGQCLFPLVSAAGQKLFMLVLSHFFPALFNYTSQMFALLPLKFPPQG
jgi:hypothetical protein